MSEQTDVTLATLRAAVERAQSCALADRRARAVALYQSQAGTQLRTQSALREQ
jgi:hypothetical protein